MTNSTFLGQSFDHLGALGAQLRDLQGYATLARELIQNADDAHASWMRFDIRGDVLILDNDGVFSDCKNVESPECPWRRDDNRNHKCDFHRFRSISSGDKRLQEGTTGAFGIGFISVYQLTDRPELISSGRHWILRQEESEDKRIEVCSGCPKCKEPDLPGTRFIFPFAREESLLRQELEAEPAPGDVTARLLEELERSLPAAMLFLKNLRAIEVKESGVLRQEFERKKEDDTVIISQGASDNDSVWRLLQGNFQSEAEDLRRQHPERIEKKRSTSVMVALPDGRLRAGLLYAGLPTEESPGLPFHINADFFPSNNRKHVILDDDYQSHWNRAALKAAAEIVAEETPRLIGALGAERFWHLASTLHDLSRKGNRDSVWTEFWNALKIVLQREAVVLTSSGNWTTANGGVTFLQHREEADNIHVLQGLGIELVSEALRPYQTILHSIGAPPFDLKTLCSALTANGLDKPVRLDDLPSCLKSGSGRAALWSEIGILLQRQKTNPHMKRADEERLRAVSLAPTVDKALRPCKDTFCADGTTVPLFASLGLTIPFLDRTETDFEPLSYLCNEFEAKHAVRALEKGSPATIQQRWKAGEFRIQEVIAWFADRRGRIINDNDTRRRLAQIAMYPSANTLMPLTELVLPGDFDDPLGLASLIDMEDFGERREFLSEFLLALGVQKLDFRAYALHYLSPALNDGALDPTMRNKALTLLAKRLSELRRDDEVRQKLSSVRLVQCTDGECRRADECYFSNDAVQEVLGPNAFCVDLLDGRETSVRELFEWLGVESEPRLRDVVRTVHRIVAGPCSKTAVDRIKKIVDHLGRRFENLEKNSELASLKRDYWLPAREDTSQWHQPNSLYAPYRAYLFESQAKILDSPSPTPNRGFLGFLGVQIEPTPALVVRHLLYCAEREVPVNLEVYRFLDQNADNLASLHIQQLESTRCLWFEGAYQTPGHVFWGDHPFGRYRWRLDDGLREYRRLLEKIGVAEASNHEDALRVLHEISSEFGDANRRLGDEEYAVLMACWEMCAEALDQDAMSDRDLGSLGKTKSIPNKYRMLYCPTWLFFEDRRLAAKFGTVLEKNVIPHQPEVERAFLAAGVRPLRTAVEVKPLRVENPDNDLNMKERLSQRKHEIDRVLFRHMDPQGLEEARDRLRRLKCKSATLLEFQFALTAFKLYRKSQPESESALYEPDKHLLWTTQANGQMPWVPLARELAIALCPEKETGPIASGLKDVLAADTPDEAATILDDLGYVQLDTTGVGTPPSQKAVQQLGTDALVNDENDEGHPPPSGNKSRRDVSPEDDIEGDTKRQPDITQAPIVSAPESSEQTSASGAGRVRPPAQRNDPVSRPRGHRDGARQKAQSGGRREFVSYVAVKSGNEEESDPDDLSRQKRMALEDKSIKLILEEEPELERMSTNNLGFDLIQLGPDGQPVKWVEVKAMKSTLHDRPVGISRTQFECAQKRGEAYWLYVVENAETPERARIVRIQNPAGRARTFTFDHGWIAANEETGTAVPREP